MITEPDRPADVRVDLVTRQQMLSVGGRSISGFTVNGTSPGPKIRAKQGQLIEVHLTMSRSLTVSRCIGTGWTSPTLWMA
jgi:FtsP/CotA-like multicopper oxidase with cupredoxin domain